MGFARITEQLSFDSGAVFEKTATTISLTVSDAVTFEDDVVGCSVSVYALNNGGTLNTGDKIDVYLMWATGDVDGDASDDFDTNSNALFLGRLQTYAALGQENPIIKTFDIPVSAKGFKIRFKNGSPSNSFTVRGAVVKHVVTA